VEGNSLEQGKQYEKEKIVGIEKRGKDNLRKRELQFRKGEATSALVIEENERQVEEAD
jgi:hypothetical protein